MQKIVIQTHSAAETMQLAEQMGSLLQAGDCIAYFGGLGAGKTTFTRGLAKGMGLPDEVASPDVCDCQRVSWNRSTVPLSFRYVSDYRGRIAGNHRVL